MLVNDPIQGILFDANEKVEFVSSRAIHKKALDAIVRLKKLQKSATQRRKTRLGVSVVPYLGDEEPYELSLTEKLDILNKDRTAKTSSFRK